MAPGTYIELAVADSGCGMDEETRTHAFEPFFTTKGVGHGTGLGLATVYGIVSQSAGYAAIDSVPGAGTTIRVYLPVVEEATAIDAPPVRAERTPGGTETILVVDDERSVRATIAAQLARQGYNVLTADSPDMALLVARQHEGPIALLLTDVVMPGMSGVELRARLLVERPGLKTVFMTGYTVTELPGQFSAAAGTMLLAKPIAASDLVATIRTTLGASPGVGH
jgi:CheY-like chemotaxis protein